MKPKAKQTTPHTEATAHKIQNSGIRHPPCLTDVSTASRCFLNCADSDGALDAARRARGA
jgi:hypothetical protein